MDTGTQSAVGSPSDRRGQLFPLVVVGAAVAWNLLHLRAETRGVSYLDDSSVHEQMVRFATSQLQAGHLPLTSWFPYLGLGSPQFLHYQSLPAMLTGVIGLVTGPDAAFRWTLYLLLSLWPISIYLSARLFDASRWAAGAAAAMSPFLMSVPGVGYEQTAYIWVGYGVWAQLWASWTLPLAWGLSWRAQRTGRNLFGAVALVSLTVALHFETGYLALMPLLLWPFVCTGPLGRRVRRAGLLIGGSLLATAWVTVPLIANRMWAATNEVLHATPLVNGYGARQVLEWLVSGQLLDAGRIPVVSVFAAVGFVLACGRWRTDENGRALLVVFVACLLLSFGRTTFGSLVDVIPGSGDVFFRRFMMGAQLAALLLAGTGAAWLLRALGGAIERSITARRWTWPVRPASRHLVLAAIAIGVLAIVLAPAWTQLAAFDRHNTTAITAQRRADAAQGAEVGRLVSIVDRDGGGRVYAGMPSNWGMTFTVGAVPVFKYLESKDVDEVGYTLRTASLMTDPEYYFDEANPADYVLFGIHYLILPCGAAPPVPARLVTRAGPYCLLSVASRGYVHVGSIIGSVTANRTNVGVRSIPLLQSGLAQAGGYLHVAFGHGLTPLRPLPSAPPAAPAGSVVSETDDLEHGRVVATVSMRRPGVVVLSASFDPGWTVSIDGRRGAVQMVAPALVATNASISTGEHTIVFQYVGYGGYPELFVLAALALGALLAADIAGRKRRSGD